MKDRRVIAIDRVLSRREALGRKLDAALAAQRADVAQKTHALSASRAQTEAQAAKLALEDAKLDAMLDGAFRPDVLLALREWRAEESARLAACEGDTARAVQMLAVSEAACAEARLRIVRNRARIDVYTHHRDRLAQALAQAREDAEEEETSEQRRPACAA
ncbi:MULTISPECIES: type III secretion system protein [unclassified Paraburkholderia]|uniref:type III secretion system protein n=1 Tax=unclassified Paraburkholderia TaxID=2615204 RepID=UPI002AAF1D66|nr:MULTISPECIES: type III secretion system protein [unclassified Paraburkholderia]